MPNLQGRPHDQHPGQEQTWKGCSLVVVGSVGSVIVPPVGDFNVNLLLGTTRWACESSDKKQRDWGGRTSISRSSSSTGAGARVFCFTAPTEPGAGAAPCGHRPGLPGPAGGSCEETGEPLLPLLPPVMAAISGVARSEPVEPTRGDDAGDTPPSPPNMYMRSRIAWSLSTPRCGTTRSRLRVSDTWHSDAGGQEGDCGRGPAQGAGSGSGTAK